MSKIVIYLLRDPRNGQAKYVGATNNLKNRYSQHLCAASSRSDCHSVRWLRLLIAKTLKPIVEILDTVTEQEAEDAERAWILGFRQSGSPLTNQTEGGEGTRGWKMSSETKEKIARAKRGRPSVRKGYKHSLATIKKISAAKMGVTGLRPGYRHSPETRRKISDAKIGRTYKRPTKLNQTQQSELLLLYQTGIRVREIALRFGISRALGFQIVKKWRLSASR